MLHLCVFVMNNIDQKHLDQNSKTRESNIRCQEDTCLFGHVAYAKQSEK